MIITAGTIIRIHILIQMFAYGVVFPIGMVFGVCSPDRPLSESRLQRGEHTDTDFLLYMARRDPSLRHRPRHRRLLSRPRPQLPRVHRQQCPRLLRLDPPDPARRPGCSGTVPQGALGEGDQRAGAQADQASPVLGKLVPILSWTQMLFGGITALGFCQGDYLGQCAAHLILGSAFIGYGILLTVILLVGQVWLRRSGRSQDFYDSGVLAAWGCVNTFTEHHWGTAWVRNDWQHTTIGIIWWCADVVGMWLSWDRGGKPKRNFIPGAVLFITG
ncbi:uncharacterized protein BDV17DRAFT_234514 [Aspergillus undulatus]|uniref:uncharacterized protein n=1 Tax=Aspergillus undulatus TaxID=1810928 RepID=UPI003CCCC654